MKTISAYKARTNFGELLNEVYYKDEEVVVKRKGKPMVKITKVKSEEKKGKNSLMTLAGIIDDKTYKKMTKVVREGRNDGSRSKKYLAK